MSKLVLEKNKELPKSWTTIRFGDYLNLEYGKGLPKNERKPTGKIPMYGSSGIIGYHDESLINEPCLIIGRKGSAGKVHYVHEPCYAIDTTYYLKQNSLYDLKFLYHLLESMHSEFIDSSTTIPSLRRDDVYSTEIVLPPLNEQKRIVAKIEELFSRLDAGVEALKKAREQLKRYRQSVLKSAFEGKLTEQWRKENRDKIEPASVLLEHIKEERRKSGKKFEELPLVDTSELPQLPEGWMWTGLREVSELISGQHVLEKDYNCNGIGIPYITGPIDFARVYPIISKWTEKPKVIAKKNDVLVTVKGAGVGKVNILNIDQACISRQLMALRPLKIYPHLVFYFISFNFYMFQKLGVGSTVPGIDRESILNIIMPLPPLLEQQKVIEEIERSFSVIEETEKVIEHGLKQAERLRQSVLKMAFEGKLVPQDLNDEPANILLERIREDKVRQESRENTQMKKTSYRIDDKRERLF